MESQAQTLNSRLNLKTFTHGIKNLSQCETAKAPVSLHKYADFHYLYTHSLEIDEDQDLS